MKKEMIVAALLALPLAACARSLPAKALSDTVDVSDGRPIEIVMDGGTLIVKPSKDPVLTYQVEFKGSTGWLVDFLGGTGPTEEQLAKSVATYTKEGGLVIKRADEVQAYATVTVPADRELIVRLGGGKADIGPMTGRVDARMGGGLLQFDGSALPKGVCVNATVKKGGVDNERDRNCDREGVRLHNDAGGVNVL